MVADALLAPVEPTVVERDEPMRPTEGVETLHHVPHGGNVVGESPIGHGLRRHLCSFSRGKSEAAAKNIYTISSNL